MSVKLAHLAVRILKYTAIGKLALQMLEETLQLLLRGRC